MTEWIKKQYLQFYLTNTHSNFFFDEIIFLILFFLHLKILAKKMIYFSLMISKFKEKMKKKII